MKIIFRPFIIIFVLFIFFSYKGFAYNSSFRTWLNLTYNDDFKSNPNWLYGFLLEGRFENQPGLFYQGLVHGQIGYFASQRIKVWLGYAWLPATRVVLKRRIHSTIERLYQQIEINALNDFNYQLFTRSRIEERRRVGDKGINLLFRQRMMWDFPFLLVNNSYSPFLSNELFINFNHPTWTNQKIINQNRAMFGFNFPCAPYLCQIAYLNQYLVERSGHQMNNVLYFSLTV